MPHVCPLVFSDPGLQILAAGLLKYWELEILLARPASAHEPLAFPSVVTENEIEKLILIPHISLSSLVQALKSEISGQILDVT